MSEGEPVTIMIDLNVDEWTVLQSHEYRRVIGVNPEYAMMSVQRSWNEGVDEMSREFGAAVDEDGWRPPEGYAPLAILNIDAMYLLGFAWIAHRREHPEAAFDAWAETVPLAKLNEAFYESMTALVGAQQARPLNREQRRANGRRSKTASPSASSSTGPSETSTTVPSASSAEPSTS